LARWQITEKLLAKVWQRKLVSHLVADTGEEVEVVHPGRRNKVGGSDFTNAILSVNNKMVEGEVELHVASSEWYTHGHNLSAKYDGVVLHVVWYHDSYYPARVQSGKIIPTVALSQAFGGIVKRLSSDSQAGGRLPPNCQSSYRAPVLGLASLIGELRFFNKAQLLKRTLQRKAKASQVLFRYICRALGYAQNCEPFQRLADGVEIEFLEKCTDNLKRKAFLFGFAGLLPSQRANRAPGIREDSEAIELEAVWRSTGNDNILCQTDWCFFRVRPDNLPPRRIAALAELISRYSYCGLVDSVIGLVSQAPSGAEQAWLESELTVRGTGYWGNHIDFGLAKSSNSAILGRERAADIAVNVVLPFAFAWGEIDSKTGLSDKAFYIFQKYGKLADNEIVRYMRQQLGLSSDVTLSASQHQGLIYLFETYCHSKACDICPLTKPR
jgi:hypothetical protein